MKSVSHRQCFPFLSIIVVIVILNVSSFKHINNVFAKDDSSTTNEAPSSSSLIPTMEAIDNPGTDANLNICIQEQKLDGTIVSKNIQEGTNPNTNECNNRSVSSSNGNLITSQIKNTPIFATEEGGVIIGTSGPDAMYGKDHDDIIQSREGTDELYGGEGDDHLQGGESPDTLVGEDGDDVINGGFEDDYLNGGKRNDLMYGSSGDDVLEGGPGQDYFNCGDGVDVVLGYSTTEGDIITSDCEDV
jgi:Ca2+-binding RTX toxin-like protein